MTGALKLKQKKEDVQVIVTDTGETDQDKLEYQRPAYVAVGLIMAMTAFSICFPLIVTSSAFAVNVYETPTKFCTDPCVISLVESIPENLTYPAGAPSHPSTYNTWRNLIKMAETSIEIASFYWTLRGQDIGHEDPSDYQMDEVNEFRHTLRMGPGEYKELLSKVYPLIYRRDTNFRESIKPEERLDITLRYLALGDSSQTLHHGHLVGGSTVYPSIRDTCIALTAVLKDFLKGQQIFDDLMMAGTERKIKIKIAQSLPSRGFPDKDTEELVAAGAAIVRSVNFTRVEGGGVLHTKVWIIDRKHVYIGSANMDWRSLTQVKEMGAVVYNCSCLAADMAKVFEVYWYLGLKNNTVPYRWPYKLRTFYNNNRPLRLKFNKTNAYTYISSSPSSFCPSGRTIDLDAILDVIQRSKKFIYVAVMDYFPVTLYTKKLQFWPIIDNALRRAAIERGVEVRIMASWWNYSRPDIVNFLRSLGDLNGANNASIHVRLFHVPACTPAQAAIPHGRVNHNKYMVTDTFAYIGTSNWSGDYFTNTGGVGLIVNQTSARPGLKTVQRQLRDVFLRDWDSHYALPVDDLTPPSCTPRKVAKKARKGSGGPNDL